MAALWGLQFFRKTLPIITMPYLARVLGPSGWGLVAFVQGFGMCVLFLVEFGFGLAGTRELARTRDSNDARATLLAGVLGAQALLAAAGAVAAQCSLLAVPLLREHPQMLWYGFICAIAEAMNPTWYFQGMERMGVVAGLEILYKTLAMAGIFIWVRSPEDAWLVLAVYAGAAVLSLIAALWLAGRETALLMPSRSSVASAFRIGRSMFLFRVSQSIYLGNVFLLGLFVPPVLVGYYAGAEKISKACAGALNPITEALYPRISNLVQSARQEAAHLARIGGALMGSGGIVAGAALFFLAPVFVRILLGPDFGPAVVVLRLLAVLPPLICLATAALQWLLPLGKETVVNRILFAAGVLNLVLGLVLAPRYAHIGMAWATIGAESFICIAALYLVTFDANAGVPFSVRARELQRRFTSLWNADLVVESCSGVHRRDGPLAKENYGVSQAAEP